MKITREGVIYKVTNKVNGKIYVGKDSCFKDGYLGSGKAILRAIAKYGRDNFVREEIDKGFRGQELNNKEKFWIRILKSQNPDVGYNIADGGGCGFLTEVHKKRIGDSNRGKKRSDELRKYFSESRIGTHRTPETKEKIRQANIGKKLSIEHRRKIGEARRRYEKERAKNSGHMG